MLYLRPTPKGKPTSVADDMGDHLNGGQKETT